MAILNGKIAFKLFLVIIMVIQPVAITHAMANMGHSQHQSTVSNKQSDDEHHGMHHVAADVQQETHEAEDNGVMSDCCSTSGCCPAAAVDIKTLEHVPVPVYSAHIHSSWKGIILSSKTKPPKRFFL